MRHKSYTTMLRYINLSSQMEDAAANMPVPTIFRKEEALIYGREFSQPKREKTGSNE